MFFLILWTKLSIRFYLLFHFTIKNPCASMRVNQSPMHLISYLQVSFITVVDASKIQSHKRRDIGAKPSIYIYKYIYIYGTGTAIGVWQISGEVRKISLGCRQMHRWIGTTLLSMCKGFSCLNEEADDSDIIWCCHWCPSYGNRG